MKEACGPYIAAWKKSATTVASTISAKRPASEPVRQHAEPGDQEHLYRRGDQDRVERVGARQLQVGRDVRRDEQDEGVEGDVDTDPRADREQHPRRVQAQ